MKPSLLSSWLVNCDAMCMTMAGTLMRTVMISEGDVLTIGLDADHTLSIKRAPCCIACFCLAEITAANDGSLRSRRASSFDFLPVARIELDGTKAAVKLDKSNGDDRGASVGKELLDEGSFVHGFGRVVGFSAREGNIPANGMEKGPFGPSFTICNNYIECSTNFSRGCVH